MVLKSILRFVLMQIWYTVIIVVVVLGSYAILGIDLSSGFMVLLPFLAAAMHEGKLYVLEFGETPQSSEMWEASRYMALVTTAMMAGVTWLLVLYFPAEFAVFQDWAPARLAFVALIVYIFNFLNCRLFVWLGARNEFNKRRRRRR